MILLRQNKLPNGQRGAVTIMFAIFLVVLLGFAALALDLGRMNLTKVQLQSAADAAALGGAGSLVNSSLSTYDWDAAEQKGLVLAQHNIVNGEQIQQATIEAGYWNSSDGFRHHGTSGVPVTGDVPAVRATVALTSTQNNGPLKLFFAPFLGINESNIPASAIAAIYPPAGGVGMFPFTLGKDVFNNFWDSETQTPKTEDPFMVNLETYYPKGGMGTWTSLTEEIGGGSSDVTTIGGIFWDKKDDTPIRTTIPMKLGQEIWVADGDMSILYKNKQYEFPIGEPIVIPVIENVDPGSWQPIVAFAGFVIDSSHSQGTHSYITGHFIDATTIPGLIPGNGSGVPYGAFTPPYLVQ
ncbi:conserved hypothetical protein [Chlorobaculum parvum NCIB 8327]|uniref:Putative Flp pilus-assembly TadG-like N-terminal domain-containing protein n=1 Tax=Chlorobaculum parvum (strain DSM 263 / NCIMB 8327) TaxID=517417 RepID=B3QPL3_CHLP8|nr:pilus assembly protein TadG-related protein [Chlorobaculum parvum]ACF11866.1 conserved hypothetical protein [Chlorobaculum parvum NCIB 8327]